MKPVAVPALIIVLLSGLYLILTSAFYPLDFLSVFDAKRVLQAGLFASLLTFAFVYAPLRESARLQIARLAGTDRLVLAAFFVIGIASSLRLDHPAYALVDVSMMFVLLVLIAITAASRDLSGTRFDRWAVILLAAMGLAVFIEEFMGFFANWALGTEFSYQQALIHFAHPRFYNQLQTWSIPVIAALPLLFPGKRWIRVGCVILLGLQWFLVIMLAARGTIVSLLTAMVFIALWLPAQRRNWLKYQLAGVLAGILLYTGILFLNDFIVPETQAGEFYTNSVGRPLAHTSGRSTLWRLSVEDARSYPFLGAGPTRYACDNDLFLPAHPHSFPFRILGEWGVVALALVLMLIIRTGFRLLKHLKYQHNGRKDDRPLKAMLATSLIAGTIHASLSGLFIMPASQVLMVLIAGWMLSLAGRTVQSPGSPPQKKPIFGYVILSVGLALIFSQSIFVAREVRQLDVRTAYSKTYGPMVPRFWQNGRICEYSFAKPDL